MKNPNTAISLFRKSHMIIKRLRLQLQGAIYRSDSFVLMLRHCVTLKAIRYESTSLNRIAANKSHRVIVAKATITRCDLSPRFFCIDATLLCEFESDRYESASFNRIVDDKSHRVIAA